MPNKKSLLRSFAKFYKRHVLRKKTKSTSEAKNGGKSSEKSSRRFSGASSGWMRKKFARKDGKMGGKTYRSVPDLVYGLPPTYEQAVKRNKGS